MKMTEQEIEDAIKYFSLIKEKVLIEVEVKNDEKFRENYKKYPCSDINESFYKIYNKWGEELRIYYIEDEKTPDFITKLSVSNTRHGYEGYNKRLNNNELVYKLFEMGFCIGKN